MSRIHALPYKGLIRACFAFDDFHLVGEIVGSYLRQTPGLLLFRQIAFTTWLRPSPTLPAYMCRFYLSPRPGTQATLPQSCSS